MTSREQEAFARWLCHRALLAPDEVTRMDFATKARMLAIISKRPELEGILPRITRHPAAYEFLGRLSK